jgi:hypothetical protein
MSFGNQIDRRAFMKVGSGALGADLLSATTDFASDTLYPSAPCKTKFYQDRSNHSIYIRT